VTPREVYLPERHDVDQLIVELARTDSRSFPTDSNKPICLKSRHIIPNLPLYPEELFMLNQLQTPRTLQDLIAHLRAEFDTIILDCPPSGPISDAQILTGLADRFLMAVQCGKTTCGSAKIAFRNLDLSKLIGLISNDVKPMIFNTQYDHKQYYHGNRQQHPYAKAKIARRRKTCLE
jgi:Mrp family chromosome partitioning ATPase